MNYKALLTIAALSSTFSAHAGENCGKLLRQPCVTVYEPAICTIIGTNSSFHGSNSCVARNQALYYGCVEDLNITYSDIKCETDLEWGLLKAIAPQKCPVFSPPAPGFCEDGELVVDEDDRGCLLPPRCVR
ncbi:hypothetical protein [Pseudobacteriovorax antillogorgiicola]|uniref:Kazal-type serine protease inhibitor domain-containing protein n=1 Tax=Pseudobacteriovorax antillogorgiicola TaxID=1513793 RepID=A0A1Y6C1S8_9BACT|nr:hypothetical protein [Pseudobacteriovorax antillogorgiicola]TCS52381.1 hypothetical protein EDD56_109126 [Pseudobacteriovorax antillogorgiicola]SMF29248.1 hypothetical protein SAMN06296036_10987 [Pseudobacteriovorax antillogorgiicola]